MDEEDENYIDQVYQKQQMFIQTMKQTLKESDFQNDWLSNDSAQIGEVQEEQQAADMESKFNGMGDMEAMMDGILTDTQKDIEILNVRNFGLKQLIKEI